MMPLLQYSIILSIGVWSSASAGTAVKLQLLYYRNITGVNMGVIQRGRERERERGGGRE